MNRINNRMKNNIFNAVKNTDKKTHIFLKFKNPDT